MKEIIAIVGISTILFIAIVCFILDLSGVIPGALLWITPPAANIIAVGTGVALLMTRSTNKKS